MKGCDTCGIFLFTMVLVLVLVVLLVLLVLLVLVLLLLLLLVGDSLQRGIGQFVDLRGRELGKKDGDSVF